MKNCIICNIRGTKKVFNDLDMYECASCGLVWRRDFDISAEFYKDYFYDIGPDKLQARIANCEDRVNTFKRYANLDYLCDIGCGEGIFAKVLEDKGYQHIIGIEPNDTASSFAKDNGLDIHQGTVDDIDLFVKKFSIKTVTMFHLIEHLGDPFAALQKIYKSLPMGGKLIVETPNICSYAFRRLDYRHPLIYPEHLFYFSDKNLSTLIEKIGFRVVASGRRGFNTKAMSIRESLFRLGLIKSFSSGGKSDGGGSIEGKMEEAAASITRRGMIRAIIRRLLNSLVVACGRVDYMWIVAEKTKG